MQVDITDTSKISLTLNEVLEGDDDAKTRIINFYIVSS